MTNRKCLTSGALLFALAVISPVVLAQDRPKNELFGGYSLFDPDSNAAETAHGWVGAYARNVNNWFGVVAEFSGHSGDPAVSIEELDLELPDVDLGTFFYLFGPRFTLPTNRVVQPFGHVLIGGVRSTVSSESDDLPVDVSISRNDPALALGGGVDIIPYRRLGFRFQGDLVTVDFDTDDFRFQAGVFFRF